MADGKNKICANDIETHCDNPISLDEVENGLWLGMFEFVFFFYVVNRCEPLELFFLFLNLSILFQGVLRLRLILKH